MKKTPVNSLTTKEQISLAKSRGYLTYKLMRSSAIGWVAFLITLTTLIVAIGYIAFKPNPILVVNQDGNLVAHLNWKNTVMRKDEELALAVREFVLLKNSVSSEIVEYQRLRAFNLLSTSLQGKLAEQVAVEIRTIKKNKNNGYVEIDETRLVKRSGLNAIFDISGNIVLISLTKGKIKTPFEYLISLTIVERSVKNPLGIIITAVND